LFRKSPEKIAREAAGKAEIKRLRALAVNDLAVEVFSALGPDGPSNGYSARPQQLCEYLVRDFPGTRRLDILELLAAVGRALELLRQAELVQPISLQRSPVWHLTPAGEVTLAEGTIRQRLKKTE
jgi:hypothetical protein